jgi:hypothetical protein
MSACLNQSLAKFAPIALGLRVGVIGSENFKEWVCGVLRRDQDVSVIKTLNGLSSPSDGPSLNVLIVEGSSLPMIPPSAMQETVEGVSLVAVAGNRVDYLETFENVCQVQLQTADWWSKTKEQAVQRRLQEFAGLVNALASEYQTPAAAEHTLRLDDGGESNTVHVSSVDWIRAAGNYVEVRVNGRSHLLRSEMHNVQGKLTRSFLRIHRKVIINMTRLAAIESDGGTRLYATLTTGERFPISRGRRSFVRSRWEELRGHQH